MNPTDMLRLLLFICFVSPAFANYLPDTIPTKIGKRELVWFDEFDGSTQGKPGQSRPDAARPDTARWSYDVGGTGFGNNELQFYTNDRPENARVENGLLIIEARKETFQNRSYTSAKLRTKGKVEWKHGRFEIRAKLPAGRGTWPAIWMLAGTEPFVWPDDGEIDIMEHVGFDPGMVHGTVHTQAYNHVKKTQQGAQINVSDASTVFHTYGIDWTSAKIDFLVDGKIFFTFDKESYGKRYEQWPFDQSFYLILNLAVGGNWGGQKGVDEAIWPQRMEVDWVRVYQ
jgi:beta-glucanase (GH16 family)